MDAQEALGKILTQVQKNVGFFLRIIVTFSFHSVYRRRFDCSCSSPESCVVYLLVPCLVIWILLLAVDKLFLKSITRMVKEEKSRGVSWRCALNRLVLTFCVSLIWAVSVLLDGDWYVCCSGNNPVSPVSDTVLKTTSWNYGMYTLLLMAGIILANSLVKKYLADVKLFELLMEEEERAVMPKVRQAMRTRAELGLKDHVDRGEWREAFFKGQEIFEWSSSGAQSSEEPPSGSQDNTSGGDTPEEDTSQGRRGQSCEDFRRRPRNDNRRKENGTFSIKGHMSGF
ncbi:hypothetical protein NL108_011480 [Boleophthalmus pectinirostris]|nr:hypothetical protein NL108_011480 [Boleophthalmus pectinirostris]